MEAGAESLLETLLTENNVLDKSEKVGDAMYKLRWGSATVITAIVGGAIVVIAPMFEQLPEKNQGEFCKRLLELNSQIGGTASFGVREDGAVVLQVGRGVDGLDAAEFRIMLGTVGKFADDFDDVLHAEFYA